MGWDAYACIEYDASGDDSNPFENGPIGVIPFFDYSAFRMCKDSQLRLVMIGSSKVKPIFERRGLPANATLQALEGFDFADTLDFATWLNYKEIRQAIQALGIKDSDFSDKAYVMLKILEDLAGLLGQERVRLLYCVD